MSFNDEICGTLKEVERNVRNMDGSAMVFNWPHDSANEYPVSATSGTFGKTLSQGGWGTDANRSITVRRDVFAASIPALKQRILFDGFTYRIDDIENPPGNPFMVLKLIDPTKGV